MSLTEFELIQQCFAEQAATSHNAGVILGIGDDCAILSPPAGQELLVSVDTLVAGVHFPESLSPAKIAGRCLAVNLSDLAAMGAVPSWFTLALTLPDANEKWLTDFSRGLFALAGQYGISLVGGDTTRGPLSITIQVQGYAPAGQALRRDGAMPGDLIYVSGSLGDAGGGLALALAGNDDDSDFLLRRFVSPEPRLRLGQQLRGVASAAIDISDGLLADLGHILTRSQVGAELQAEQLPISAELLAQVGPAQAQQLALGAGDDYELCFCVPADKVARLEAMAQTASVELSQVGVITKVAGLRVFDSIGQPVEAPQAGYQHF